MNQRSLIRFAGFLLVVVLVSAACTSTPADNSDALRNGVQRLFANSLDDERYRIAVLPLADYRTGETDELGRYISGDVMYQISVDHSNRVQMVEREMITQLLSELEFDIMSGMVSDSDVKQFGEMSGANHLIMGTKLEMGDEIEANLRLVEVESGEIRGVSKFQLAVDRRYAALISGDVTVAEAPPPPIEQPDNPWTDGRDLAGTTVTVLGVFDDVEAELFEASMHRFEEQTGIDVSYQVSSHFEAEVLERVEAGDAPDAVIIPQPGLAAELVDRGAVHDIREWFGSSYLAEQYNQMWRDSAEIGGIQAGVWYRASVKSIVWYNRPVFERHRYAIPETWEDLLSLSDRIVADGYTPWSIAIESGNATGWPGTDWIEDIMLRLHTPDVYDRWVAGEVPFDSPEVREAFDYLADIWFQPGYVLGGREGIAETWFGNGILPLTQTPPEAVMHRQAHFMTNFMPDGGAEIGDTIGFFYLPPIDPAMGRPVLGSGDMISALADRPEVRAFMRYVSQGISTREWVESGGFISPHDDTPLAWYSSDTDSGIASMLRHATIFRFDASDLMPPEVGAGRFWSGITEYVRDDDADLRQILRSIDAAYP